jgi:hypothetical protein
MRYCVSGSLEGRWANNFTPFAGTISVNVFPSLLSVRTFESAELRTYEEEEDEDDELETTGCDCCMENVLNELEEDGAPNERAEAKRS